MENTQVTTVQIRIQYHNGKSIEGFLLGASRLRVGVPGAAQAVDVTMLDGLRHDGSGRVIEIDLKSAIPGSAGGCARKPTLVRVLASTIDEDRRA